MTSTQPAVNENDHGSLSRLRRPSFAITKNLFYQKKRPGPDGPLTLFGIEQEHH